MTRRPENPVSILEQTVEPRVGLSFNEIESLKAPGDNRKFITYFAWTGRVVMDAGGYILLTKARPAPRGVH